MLVVDLFAFWRACVYTTLADDYDGLPLARVNEETLKLYKLEVMVESALYKRDSTRVDTVRIFPQG